MLAFADPHPPGARARAQLAAQAIIELVASRPNGEDLAEAVHDLVGHIHAVGQTTLHQPGVRNMLDAVLAGSLAGDPAEVVGRMRERYESALATMTSASETMAAVGSGLLDDRDTILVHDFADRPMQAVSSAKRRPRASG